MNGLKLFLLLIGLSTSSYGFVKDPIYDDLEGYDLILSLIKDGKMDLAQEELNKKEMRSKDTNRYHWLQGKLFYGKNEWKKALAEFEQVSSRAAIPVLNDSYLQQGRVYFHLQNSPQSQKFFSKVMDPQIFTENDLIWKSQAEYNSQNIEKAWKTLHEAQVRFQSFAIEREIISLKVTLALHHEALEQSLQWLESKSAMPSQFMNIAEIFHSQNHPTEALYVLEGGRAQYPMDIDINLTLSQMYFQKNLLLASAEGFSRAAETDGKYHYHAAELYRQLGMRELSQYANVHISEPKEKLKQKIALFVDTGNFPMIASLESIIQRSELNKDDEIKYALAYSLVREGQIDQPLKYLSQITKPELIEKTTVLRKTLIDCQTNKESCRL